MRHTSGGTWLVQLMILFILLFAGYIILTIEYSKNVRVKNEMISIIERYDGLNEKSITLLNNYLISTGYNTLGKCESDEGTYGALELQYNELEETNDHSRYYYCVKKYKGANTSYYYQVTVFYRFNLPVLGDVSRFTIKGTTTNFQSKDDSKYCMTISGPCRSGDSFSKPNGGNNNNNNNTVYYTVSFDLNGGSGNIPTQSVRAGRRADQPKNPTREGYRFAGWTLNGSSFDFYTYINSNITLVAQWESGTFEIPAGYTLAGTCSKNNVLPLKDFIVNCGQNYGYYTSSSLIIVGQPVTNGVKTSLPNIRGFACNDYSSFFGLNYTSSQIDSCKNQIDSLYNSLPNNVIYK